ncbi:MAG TPA: cytochrome c [Micropepsaceae bacterium]|nr:cytochrome c [Micropepsaceae bacterium]
MPKQFLAGNGPIVCVMTIALSVALAGGAVRGQDDTPAERGKAFAQENCARCHAIGMDDASPYAPAPPFRTLHNRYDVGDLAEAFAEGIIVVHDGSGQQMPEFMLDPGQIADLITYLRSLQPENSTRAAAR